MISEGTGMPAPLSQAIEDYLKAIYRIAESDKRVTTNELAGRLGVSAASVTNMMKRLARLRLVRHEPYRGVELTEAGEKVALEVIRHHRLLELYLSRHLGVRLDRVHHEADRLEHVISEDLEERIAASLGQPDLDPHGDPIPARDGSVAEPVAQPLSSARPGQRGVIVRVSDRDDKLVRDLTAAGLLPGVSLVVVSAGARHVDVEVEGMPKRISAALAGTIYLALELAGAAI
jgi:DtxR family transcriptional regulator, Mn-dependent transcriptional regulator